MSTPQTGPQPEDQRPGGAPTDSREGKHGFLQSIKGPLWFSFALALIGGAVVTMASSGGTDNPVRFDLGLIAFGVFFMVSLVVVAMLQLAAKDNPEHLSRGSGVHRSSEELHRKAVAKRKAEAQRKREESGPERSGGTTSS
ncbi:hypothetical protein [Microbacterium sp. A93]|uniref:hypothetical protein n=1 Tax=Microbacterium sp. A93 TaxID=3450716 RepID=UPI003F43FB17